MARPEGFEPPTFRSEVATRVFPASYRFGSCRWQGRMGVAQTVPQVEIDGMGGVVVPKRVPRTMPAMERWMLQRAGRKPARGSRRRLGGPFGTTPKDNMMAQRR